MLTANVLVLVVLPIPMLNIIKKLKLSVSFPVTSAIY